MDIEVTKESIHVVKEMFKKHLGVESLSSLTDAEYSVFISSCSMIMAREYGVEIHGQDEENLEMKDLLKLTMEWNDNRNQ